MYRLTIALTLALAAGGATAATMYRWTDEHGGAQFTQQPPADRSYQQVDIRGAPNLGSPVRSQPVEPAKPADGSQADISTDRNSATTKQEEKAKRQATCDKLRENLKTLSDNPRLSRTNEAGEVERIGEDERQSMIAETKQNLASYCQDQ